MKYLVTLIVVVLLAFAQVASAAPVSWDFASGILQPLASARDAVVRAASFTATSTTATSTFPRASISTGFSVFGVFGNSWDDFCVSITGSADLCDGSDASGGGGSISTSTNPTPGQLAWWTSLSTLGAVATGTLTETVTGLGLSGSPIIIGGNSVLSLSAGYTIPPDTSIAEWNQAYASTTALSNSYIRGLFSASSPITYNSGTGAFTFSTAGDWTGTFDGLEGSFYLANSFSTTSANTWEGTQTARTADDLTNNQIDDLSDVAALTETTGDVLSWNGSTWTNVATSTLGFISQSFFNVFNNKVSSTSIDTSAELDALVTDQTGSGALVFGTSPTFTSPTLTSYYSAACASGEAVQDISDTGTFTCIAVGGGGGGGGALSTTTDLIGVGPSSVVSYVTGDVMFGGSSSTTAEFQLDDDGAQFIIATSSDSASTTLLSTNAAETVVIGEGDLAANGEWTAGAAIEMVFRSAGDWIVQGLGSVTDFVLNLNLHLQTGKNLLVGSVQWNSGDNIDGEAIANDTIDQDSIDFGTGAGQISLSDFTNDSGYLTTVDISSNTNLAGDSEIVLTGDTLSIAASIARDSELHSAVTLSGALDYITLVGQDIVRGAIDLATDVTGVLPIANGGTGSTTVQVWSTTIASTSPAFKTGGLLPIPLRGEVYTMARIACKVDTGTSVVLAIEDASANSTEDITCGTTATFDDGSITNASVTAWEEMYIDFGAVTGAVDYVTVTVYR